MISDVIINKLRHYCAYQERCHEEVRTKLLSLKVYGNDLEEVINKLIKDDFLNEERFAVAFAGGKFRMKKWGRLKILKELKLRKISDYCIRKAMEEIDDADYLNTLKQVIHSAKKRYAGSNTFETNGRAAKYAISRGFESELVWKVINQEADQRLK